MTTINIHNVYLCTLFEVSICREFSAVDPIWDSRDCLNSGKGKVMGYREGWRVKVSCLGTVGLGKVYFHSFI